MSPKRDVKSWWEQMKTNLLTWRIEVKGIVSDRAKALVKLAESDYLNTYSMPDLFHFVQDIGKVVGAKIGRKRKQIAKKLTNSTDNQERIELEAKLEVVEKWAATHRKEIEHINKTIHPFNQEDKWTKADVIERELNHSFKRIRDISMQARIKIPLDKTQKIINQINPIAQATQGWIDQTQTLINQWQSKQLISTSEKNWFILFALPVVYWQIQLNKTQAKAKNRELRQYYKDRLRRATDNYQKQDFTKQLGENRRNKLFLMARQLAITFQRASSQTEGRNGYLAFINHAHRGMPKNRLKVLTIIHNYDVKRADGSTPAQRLFNKEFPDLFDFICLNVHGFKEPRSRLS